MPRRQPDLPADLGAELSSLIARAKERGFDKACIKAAIKPPKPTPRPRKRLHPGDPALVHRMQEKMWAGQSFTLASERVAAEEGLDVATTSRRLRNFYNRFYAISSRCSLFGVSVVKTMHIDDEIDVREIEQTEEFFYLYAGETVLAVEAKPLYRKKTIRFRTK